MSQVDRLFADFWTGRISRREFLARAAALGVAASLVTDVLAGRLPRAAASAVEPKRGGTLRVALDGEIDTIDPHKSVTIVGFQVYTQIYEGLVRANPALDGVVPLLAERWSQPDPSTFVFNLRRGVRFHNGKEFKAEDVAFSFERVMDERFASPRRPDFLPVRKLEVLNDHQVRFTMNAPFAPFLSKLETLRIVPKIAGHDFARHPIGTGPFVFVEWVSGQHITMRRNAQYWVEDAPYLAGVQFRPIPEPATRVVALRAGDVDVLNAVPLKDVSVLERDPRIKVYRVDGVVRDHLGFHNQRGPFQNNLNLRLALAWAVDRKTIAEQILFGLARPAMVPIPENHWAFNPKVRGAHGYDLDRARRYLAEARPRPTEVVLKVSPTYPDQVKMAELLQGSLTQIGLNLKIVQLEWSTWIREVVSVGDFEAEIVLISGGIDPDDFFYQWFRSGQVFNIWRYADPRMDEMLDKARSTVSQRDRRALYHRIQEKLVADAPLSHIVYRQSVVPTTADLRDYVMTGRYDMDFRRAWLAR
jgi:peptide/nickel transport system substrate-binding protein